MKKFLDILNFRVYEGNFSEEHWSMSGLIPEGMFQMIHGIRNFFEKKCPQFSLLDINHENTFSLSG